MAVARDELGLESRRDGNVLHVTVDKRIINSTHSTDELIKLITSSLQMDDIESIVILPRKDSVAE